jgi:hypothetical protein
MKKRLVIFLTALTIVLLVLSSFVIAEKIKSDSYKKQFYDKNNEIKSINELKESVKSGNVKVLIKFKNETSISRFIDDKSLSAFENNLDVLSITPIRTRHIMLQDSLPLINAYSTWALRSNSINLTGRGQTICIIDTGINYSHPDLGGCYGNNNVSSNCKVIGGWDFCADDTNCTTEDNNPMDVHGHGTHVAGIAVANNTIKGVAPDAKIVMIKAANSSGVFWDDDIIKAIQWCVNNASTFNISVISMSLGGGSYDTYCDSDMNGDGIPSDDLYNYVGNFSAAIAQNISVVIASGNNGDYSVISAPACIESAIPVTSTNKTDDVISIFANTWNDSSLSIIAAPGQSINSTYHNGYSRISGTSMSTPHVAGAIAIMKQFLNLTGRSKTPAEIESILNATGKQIFDTYSGRYFSRIDVYDAIVYLDSEGYSVNLTSPANATYTNQNKTYICNVSSVSSLVNITLKVWNSSNILVYNSTRNVSGTSNSSSTVYNFTTEGNYLWNCEAYDSFGIAKSASNNNSITYDLTRPIITLNKPLNNSWNNGNFSINLNEQGNCSYSLNGSANISMSTIDNISFSGLNQGLTQNSTYNITFYCNDSAGNSNSSRVDLFYYDLIAPNITLIEPYPSSETASTATKVFYYNVSDNLNISSCSLDINNVSVGDNSSTINNTNNINYILSSGIYVWSINCTDQAGNTGNSSTQSFTITAPASNNDSPGGGGGGGGGGGAQSITLTEQQFNAGVTKYLGAGDKVSFSSSNTNHSLTLNKVVNNSANITIRSDPINVILSAGESIELNVTNDMFYDLFIKVENIIGARANVTIRQINESIKPMEPSGGKKAGANQSSGGMKVIMNDYFTKRGSNKYTIIAVVVVLAIIISVAIYSRKGKKKVERRK